MVGLFGIKQRHGNLCTTTTCLWCHSTSGKPNYMCCIRISGLFGNENICLFRRARMFGANFLLMHFRCSRQLATCLELYKCFPHCTFILLCFIDPFFILFFPIHIHNWFQTGGYIFIFSIFQAKERSRNVKCWWTSGYSD